MKKQNLAILIKEQNIPNDLSIILNKEWMLRSDIKRNMLFMYDDIERDISGTLMLNSLQAIIVAQFDGTKKISEIIESISKLFEVNLTGARTWVYNMLDMVPKAFCINDKNERRTFSLQDYIIPNDQLDLDRVRLYKPIRLQLHISESCNRNCIYCYDERRVIKRKEALSTEQVFKLLEEASNDGTLIVDLTGGEVFLRKDIIDIINKITELGMKLTVLSTKSYISKETSLKLKSSGINTLQVSIDSCKEDIADTLTGSKGFFKDAVATIKNLNEANIEVETNSVITPLNIETLIEHIEFLISLNVTKIRLRNAFSTFYTDDFEKLRLDTRQVKYLNDITQSMSEKHTNVKILLNGKIDYSYYPHNSKVKLYNDRPICGAGRDGVIVSEDGLVTLCSELPLMEEHIIGNVKNNTLMEIWGSHKIDDLIFPSQEKFSETVCYECDEFDDCHQIKGRCFKEALKAYGSLWAPAPNCAKAPKSKKLY